MKFVVSDFSNYPENCKTVRDILEFVKDREFTFEEVEKFAPVVSLDRFIQYLNVDLHKDFLKSHFTPEYVQNNRRILNDIIEKLKSRIFDNEYEKNKFFKRFSHLTDDEKNLQILDENILLKENWNKDRNKGEAFRLLETIWQQSFKSESYVTTNNVMYRGLSIAIETFNFQEDEFLKIMKNFNFGYWGGNNIEYFYADAVRSNNNSAWKSIEKAIDRKPFILKGKRMYEGRTFFIAMNKKWVEFRCTGWNEQGKLKFVYETTEKDKKTQKRLSFDLKEFKEYFKDQQFRDL